MSVGAYCRDQVPVLLLNVSCALLLGLYLVGIGAGGGEVGLVLLVWALVLGGWLAARFLLLRGRLRKLESAMAALDQKYLFAEVETLGPGAEQQAYFRLLKQALRGMTEQVSKSRREKDEYQEFIEQWAHELKVPLTSITLLCENNLDDVTRKVLLSTNQISDGLERVLYYARLGNVEKDYLIREVSLDSVVGQALARNKQLLIQNRIAVSTQGLAVPVKTDEKWLLFILNQLISNSVRYKKDPATLAFSAVRLPEAVRLEVRDNGIGIRESEVGRVFQKGFTGSNGRARSSATGIGLYLCKALCDALGLGITVESAVGAYTCAAITFPAVPNLTKL